MQTKVANAVITAMETNSKNTQLVSGDSLGFICFWNIERYCFDKNEEHSPKG